MTRPPSQAILWSVLLLTLVAPLSAPADVDHEHSTLSPYFFVEGSDSGSERLPLKKTTTHVRLNGYLALVKMTQVYRNQGTQPINATYIFPGSTHAAVNGMSMTIGGRRIVARIQEKRQARKTFETAKKAGKSSSLLSQKRPNVFSMQVANIMPGDEVRVTLTYSEILSAENGVYEFVYPGVVGPRYGGDTGSTTQETQWIENPYFAQGRADPTRFMLDIEMQSPLPIRDLQSPTHSIETHWDDKRSAGISLAHHNQANNRDFVLHYRLQDERILTGLTRFRAKGENYFLLASEPPERVMPEQLPKRDYFFVIDVSGSMSGFPLDTAKRLMDNLLGGLRPGDRFNILFFSGGSATLSPEPLPATPANVARARRMLMRQKGGGGTELHSAMQKALAMASDRDTSRNIVLITDGYISAEDRVFRLIDRHLHRNNVFAFGIGSSVNRHLIEGVARAGHAEAFVLTDPAAAPQQAQRFKEYIEAPALTDIRLESHGVELYDMEPAQIPDMLAQRPIMVLGKFRNAEDDARIVLHGVNGEGDHQWSFKLKDAAIGDADLPQLWARKRLERLYVIPAEDKQAQQEDILELGLKYALLTSRTSFVAVDETVRNPSKTAGDVRQPLPLPQGVSNLALGRPMPEPELWWLMLFAVLAAAVAGLRRRRHAP